MADQAKTRMEILEDELSSAGMDARAAAHFAQELIVEHPYARRFGLHTLTQQIEQRGVEPEAARVAATTLLSIELLGQGRAFGSLHRELERHGLDTPDAMAGALDGSRIYREIRGLGSEHVREPAWAPLAVALAASCLAALVVFTNL